MASVACASSSRIPISPSFAKNSTREIIDLTTDERTPSIVKKEMGCKRNYSELLDTILTHEDEKELLEIEEREERARGRNEKRLIVETLKAVERTNNELTTELTALTSRVQVLEREVMAGKRRVSSMEASYTCHVQRLTATNKELEKSLKEAEIAQRILQCPICVARQADRVTECGHVFCEECLVEWEQRWYRETLVQDGMRETIKGLLSCPTCREWVVVANVKQIYRC